MWHGASADHKRSAPGRRTPRELSQQAPHYRPVSQRLTRSNSQIVPVGNRNKALAIMQIKAHCPTTTERPLASIGGVNASCAPAQPRSGESNMTDQRSSGQSLTFEYRLAQEAIKLRLQAKGMPLCVRRTELLRKARQIDVAGELNKWLTSPGLQPPS
jgi:hypothetical protein